MKKMGTKKTLQVLFCTIILTIPFTLWAGGSRDSHKTQKEAGPSSNENTAKLTAVLTLDGKKQKPLELNGKTLQGIGPDQNVLLARNGGNLNVSNGVLCKTGNSSNPNQSNFSGLNAVIVSESGSTVTLQDVTVNSDAEGSNAVFSTGKGSVIKAKHITIHTKGNSSRGLDATYKGAITADDVDITTEGAHGAALATDKGEGTITVNGGTVQTTGEGSPNIYSTGTISASNLTGTANESEIAVIEGKNSITLDSCRLTGFGDHGVMLYQSMLRDSGQGTSVFTVRNSDLQSLSNGPFFYITNTQAKIYMTNTRLTWPSAVLLQVSGNDSKRGWGKKGENGGTLEFTAENQTLAGDIICDAISSARLIFKQGVTYKGSIDRTKTGKISISLDKDVIWTVTADSYIAVLQDTDSTFVNIHAAGHTVYYDQTDSGNSYLNGKTYPLTEGKLVPYSAKRQTNTSDWKKQDTRNGPGRGPEQGAPMSGNPPPAPPSGSEAHENQKQPVQQKRPSPIPSDAVQISAQLIVSETGSKVQNLLVTANGKQYMLQLADQEVKLLATDSLSGQRLECTGLIKPANPTETTDTAEKAENNIFVLYSYRIVTSE